MQIAATVDDATDKHVAVLSYSVKHNLRAHRQGANIVAELEPRATAIRENPQLAVLPRDTVNDTYRSGDTALRNVFGDRIEVCSRPTARR